MRALAILCIALGLAAPAARAQQAVDVPTRPGVTDRVLAIDTPSPTAVVVLISGGAGHLGIAPNGVIRNDGNFLVRTRGQFAARGFAVVVPDVPSDRERPPYLRGFRASPEHAADLGAVIAWARARWGKPVWLVGTSRGTQSAATAALDLHGAQAPDGFVLTSTILARSRNSAEEPPPLTELDLTGVKQPVLVVHHAEDPCGVCPPALLPELMKHLPPTAQLETVTGGISQGGACEAFSHHGYNGIEDRVVNDISVWIRQHG